MSNIESALAACRSAVGELAAAAERSGSALSAPRAPGKWSPSQIAEHVARSLEESAHVVSGTPSKFPSLPVFLRPIIKGLFFNRILRTGSFPRAKARKAFDPASGPATAAAARVRLESAASAFEEACRARAKDGRPVDSTVFGKVSVEDYVRFQELHTRHHCRQMTAAE